MVEGLGDGVAASIICVALRHVPPGGLGAFPLAVLHIPQIAFGAWLIATEDAQFESQCPNLSFGRSAFVG